MASHAEVIARVLADRGVTHIFGLPGGEIVAFMDACRRAGLRFVLTGHEASAAWMAQVAGQMTGIPGVCAATLGPGATNLVTGVANARLDRAPLVAITAQIPGAAIRTMTHQRLPLDRLFSPIAKASLAIGEQDTRALMNYAMDLAAAPRPGPVHLSLASDIATSECDSLTSGEFASAAEKPTGDAAVRQIAARLRNVERPLVLIGLGATPAAAPAIGALIDKLQSPFLLTPKAKGIVREDHPLFAGVASGMARDAEILETVRSADLLLAIGFDPVECDKTWFCEIEVAAIDSVSMAEGDYRPLEAVGQVECLVALLADAISRPKPWRCRRPAATARGLSPLRVIEELRSILPRDGIATCDVGSHKLLMGQFWRSYEPGTFLVSNGLSAMGFGIPAAIAAQIVRPDRPVLAVVGDGGMLMMLHNLSLIRDLGLPLLIVVLSDGSLSLIRMSAQRRGFPPCGVDFQPPDFARIAEAFGISGKRVASIPEMRNRLEHALSGRTALLMEIPIDYREYDGLV